MQLPPHEAVVLVSGCPPIRARKARYFEDPALRRRIGPPPALDGTAAVDAASAWSGRVAVAPVLAEAPAADEATQSGGVRREPELPEHEEIAPATPARNEFEPFDEEDDQAATAAEMQRFRAVARQAALDPGDGMDL